MIQQKILDFFDFLPNFIGSAFGRLPVATALAA